MLLSLQLKRTVNSSLNSVRNLLHQHYPKIAPEQAQLSEKFKTHGCQDEGQSSSDDESDSGVMEIGDSGSDSAPSKGGREVGQTVTDESPTITVHQAATKTLDFLKPFLDELHSEHTLKVRNQ